MYWSTWQQKEMFCAACPRAEPTITQSGLSIFLSQWPTWCTIF